MKKNILISVLLLSAAIFAIFSFTKISSSTKIIPLPKADIDNAGLTLPAGFSALIVADNTGEARHLAVTKEGDIYVKLGSAKDGKGILFLQDENKDGKVDKQSGFGDYGGTGMYVKDGYLYASSNTDVYRYKLNDKDEVADQPLPVPSDRHPGSRSRARCGGRSCRRMRPCPRGTRTSWSSSGTAAC